MTWWPLQWLLQRGCTLPAETFCVTSKLHSQKHHISGHWALQRARRSGIPRNKHPYKLAQEAMHVGNRYQEFYSWVKHNFDYLSTYRYEKSTSVTPSLLPRWGLWSFTEEFEGLMLNVLPVSRPGSYIQPVSITCLLIP